MTKVKKYYSKDCDAYRLSHEEKRDALYELLNEHELCENEYVTIYEYTPVKIHPNSYKVLDCLLENLDEEYGWEDGDAFEPTERMVEAEKAFIEVIKNEYDPMSYEQTGEETKTLKEWFKLFGDYYEKNN